MKDINGCLDSVCWSSSYNQKQYGWHRPQVPRHYRKPKCQVCAYCRQMQPSSLEDLALYKVLKDSTLLPKVGAILSHIPDRLYAMIGRAINANYYSKALKLVELMPADERSAPRRSLFDVKPSNEIVLTRFLFYNDIYQKLKPYCKEESSDAIFEILQFVRNWNDFKDFWATMNSLVKRFDEAIEGSVVNLLNKNITDGSNIVYVNIQELIEYDDDGQDPNLAKAKREYKSMKELQKLNQTTRCPVIFKTRCIVYPCLKAREIPFLLEDINPQDITEVDLRVTASWSVDKIDNLGQVLSECSNLSSICLWQTVANTETPENLAPALSRLLRNHSSLVKLKLGGIPLGGTMEEYPLPSAEEWSLSNCNLLEADWKSMATRSDLALKTLKLSSEYGFNSHPSLIDFIRKQATTLERLSIQNLSIMPAEICGLVSNMVQFNRLQELRLNCDDFEEPHLESLVVAFMSIKSAKKLFCEMSTQKICDKKEKHLNQVMENFCSANRHSPVFLSAIALEAFLTISKNSLWED